jgi:hypothetical protein
LGTVKLCVSLEQLSCSLNLTLQKVLTNIAAGALVLEKDPGFLPCWMWLETIVLRQQNVPQPCTYIYSVHTGFDLSRTRISVSSHAFPSDKTISISSDFLSLSSVKERSQLLDAFGDAAAFAERLKLEGGVPQGILDCQKLALKEASYPSPWRLHP